MHIYILLCLFFLCGNLAAMEADDLIPKIELDRVINKSPEIDIIEPVKSLCKSSKIRFWPLYNPVLIYPNEYKCTLKITKHIKKIRRIEKANDFALKNYLPCAIKGANYWGYITQCSQEDKQLLESFLHKAKNIIAKENLKEINILNTSEKVITKMNQKLYMSYQIIRYTLFYTKTDAFKLYSHPKITEGVMKIIEYQRSLKNDNDFNKLECGKYVLDFATLLQKVKTEIAMQKAHSAKNKAEQLKHCLMWGVRIVLFGSVIAFCILMFYIKVALGRLLMI